MEKSEKLNMSAFEALQNACSTKTFESFSKLTPGKYQIVHFKLIKTRYGKCVAVLIGRSYYWLPSYVAEQINTPKFIADLNTVRHEMNYLGRDAANKNRIMLTFDPIPDETMEFDSGIDVVG